MSPGTSSVISAKFPWQKVIPLLRLDEVASTRSKDSGEFMMRGTPRTKGMGGSSGCSEMRTPDSSATGTMASNQYSKAFHNCSWVTLPGSMSGLACDMISSS